MIKLLRSSEIQVSELGNYEILIFLTKITTARSKNFAVVILVRKVGDFVVPRPVSPSSGGVVGVITSFPN